MAGAYVGELKVVKKRTRKIFWVPKMAVLEELPKKAGRIA